MKKPLLRRPKGEGSVKQMPNGKWKITITTGRGIDGKQKRRSVTASTKAELLEKVSAIRLDKTPDTIRNMTFKDLYEEYKAEALRNAKPKTIIKYEGLWNRVSEEIGGIKLSRFNTAYISSLLLSFTDRRTHKKGEPLQNNTLILNKRLLSAIFNFAVKKEYLSKNPAKNALAGMKETKKADFEIINDEQLEAMLKDAKHHDTLFFPHSDGIHWFPLIVFAVASGMRRGEILGLRKSCIDIETNLVTVRAQVQDNVADLELKTPRAYRSFHVDPAVLQLVMDDSDPDSDFVFSNRRTHTHLSIHTLTSSFSHFLKFYDNRPFDSFSFHNFRHYNATKLITAGVDIKTVSCRLGHSDVRTTLERYAHWLPHVDDLAKSIIGANLIKCLSGA